MNELNLTPTQSIILIIVCLVILVLLLHYESDIELDLTPQIDEVEEKTKQTKLQKKTGLITAKELKDELDISGTTLKNWMDIGLVSYQSPFESSKKLYFKVSDVINFLTIR